MCAAEVYTQRCTSRSHSASKQGTNETCLHRMASVTVTPLRVHLRGSPELSRLTSEALEAPATPPRV